MIIAAQLRFHFGGELECLDDRPLRKQTSMHHRIAFAGMHHVARAQPIEKLVAITGRQDCLYGIASVGIADACRDGEKIEIVISEYGDSCFTEAAQKAQRLERLRSAAHEIAHDPQGVVRWIESYSIEEHTELIVTALDIADGVGTHVANLAWNVSGQV